VNGYGSHLSLQRVPSEHYEMLDELGRGAIGIVRRARDRRLDRLVAIKELHSVTSVARRRFAREISITARLQHPGVVTLIEAGVWPSGSPFYAMRVIEGPSLKQLIHGLRSRADREALLPHVLAVAETIAFAHREGIIHRDLKPSNVVVGRFGETVVIDWGLAKDLRLEAGPEGSEAGAERDLDINGPTATASGKVLGTPAYMPPEQALGGDVDERADIYSLGAILYHVLAGATACRGNSAAEMLASSACATPVPIGEREPGVPEQLAAIVNRAMERERASRYGAAAELADDLRRYLEAHRR
jgi:serine/threonine protein kinase